MEEATKSSRRMIVRSVSASAGPGSGRLEVRSGYETEYAVIKTVAAELGVGWAESPRQLGASGVGRCRCPAGHRGWGVGGVEAVAAGERRAWRMRSLRPRRVSSRPGSTGHSGTDRVHRRAQAGVRNRADLPCPVAAWVEDRNERLVRCQSPAALAGARCRLSRCRGLLSCFGELQPPFHRSGFGGCGVDGLERTGDLVSVL